ncbi:flagellar basal body rod protein FlgC [Alicyclobacillus tolerans]|uniref:flagellar basal body rod protein FlgC n=1 Tax=Alicyclobacillus tolerans TaxID=90970 RepID=UPI001F00F04A|nr:flagellar basal body rod protein FlgC [Alicyclobacillus tolerans]MCF8568059.1 flagellar basal body rod protein FlgC [Alicyclobacillus tolerans]
MPSWMNSLGISASGLTAQSLRMDVIANNIANANTTRTASGGPYRREMVELQPQQASQPFSSWLQSALGSNSTPTAADAGVRVAGIVQDPSPFKLVYDPTNPDAVNGYVQMPNVNVSTEMADMISASNAYQANVTAFDAGKQMMLDALNLGK